MKYSLGISQSQILNVGDKICTKSKEKCRLYAWNDLIPSYDFTYMRASIVQKKLKEKV